MAKNRMTNWGANWQKSMQTVSTAYNAGIDGITESPMEKAASASDAMLSGLTAAIQSGRTQRALRAVNLSDYKAKCKAKGGQAMQAAAVLARPKLDRYIATAAPALQGLKQQLAQMPKGGAANAAARWALSQQVMEQIKNQYRGTV
jgi:hypothetical protein